MTEIKYNKAQIDELKAIKYVKNVTSKHIIFTRECKLKVLRLSEKWIFYREIFKNLWFPEYVLKSEIPRNALIRWSKNMKNNEIEQKKWRPKKDKIDFDNMTKDQYIKYLEAKVSYLEEIKKYIDSWLP